LEAERPCEDLNLGIPTRMAQVERKDLVSTVRYRGTVEANGSVTLVPKVTANIRDILVEEGDWVQAGECLLPWTTGLCRPTRKA
jgi:multidrug efflux pump subunit AcrA (membrane-fusion protein)